MLEDMLQAAHVMSLKKKRHGFTLLATDRILRPSPAEHTYRLRLRVLPNSSQLLLLKLRGLGFTIFHILQQW